MSIVKICKIHGPLTEDKISKEKNESLVLGYQLRCTECRRDKDRKYKLNNPTKKTLSSNRARDEARRLYREGLTNIEPKANIASRERRRLNPELFKEKDRLRRLKEGQLRNTKEVCRRLKLEVSDYYNMVNNQNNLCAICFSSETRLARNKNKVCELAIDHDHLTGMIRGLLCHDCNTGIGKFKDSTHLLQSAIQYLQSHQHKEIA